MSARGESRAARTAGQSLISPRRTTGRQPATTSPRKRSRDRSRPAISVGAQDMVGPGAVRLCAQAREAFGGLEDPGVLPARQDGELLERGDHEVNEAQIAEPEQVDHHLV